MKVEHVRIDSRYYEEAAIQIHARLGLPSDYDFDRGIDIRPFATRTRYQSDDAFLALIEKSHHGKWRRTASLQHLFQLKDPLYAYRYEQEQLFVSSSKDYDETVLRFFIQLGEAFEREGNPVRMVQITKQLHEVPRDDATPFPLQYVYVLVVSDLFKKRAEL